ncbi:MAG TPA: redoxin family protein [Kofleriaceae bacterium]
MRNPRSIALVLALTAAGCSETTTTSTTTTPAPPPQAQPVAATPAAAPAKDAPNPAVAKLVGTTPPEWQVERWMNSSPRTLASLRGKVVLVRWWTAGCPYCSATAPALRNFDRTYGERGLQVIGMYHHKDKTPFEPSVYEQTARKYGFTFPVAVDPDWRTLGMWMRDRDGKEVDTGWTSVTFLVDKHGVVRHVHPGGQYVEGDAGYADLQAAIERLLAEK